MHGTIARSAAHAHTHLQNLPHGARRQPPRPDRPQRADDVADHVVEEGLGPHVHVEELPVAVPRVQQVGRGARDADLAEGLDGAPVWVCCK